MAEPLIIIIVNTEQSMQKGTVGHLNGISVSDLEGETTVKITAKATRLTGDAVQPFNEMKDMVIIATTDTVLTIGTANVVMIKMIVVMEMTKENSFKKIIK